MTQRSPVGKKPQIADPCTLLTLQQISDDDQGSSLSFVICH